MLFHRLQSNMNFFFLINILGESWTVIFENTIGMRISENIIILAVVNAYTGLDARNGDMNQIRALLKRSFADQFRKYSIFCLRQFQNPNGPF